MKEKLFSRFLIVSLALLSCSYEGVGSECEPSNNTLNLKEQIEFITEGEASRAMAASGLYFQGYEQLADQLGAVPGYKDSEMLMPVNADYGSVYTLKPLSETTYEEFAFQEIDETIEQYGKRGLLGTETFLDLRRRARQLLCPLFQIFRPDSIRQYHVEFYGLDKRRS